MSEWWSYRPSDFLLFSPRTYYRLFELYNLDLWPLHLILLALGASLCIVAVQGRARAAWLLLAPCWLWVAWAFHLQRYATIHWAAPMFAVAFAMEGALLIAAALAAPSHSLGSSSSWARRLGFALLLFSLVVHPFLGVVQGRPWVQAEVFGMAPDPTALGSVGVLLMLTPRLPWSLLLWPIPLVWCLIGAATRVELASVAITG